MQSLGLKQVRAHYEALLSEHYTWTFGGSAAKFKINYALLKELLEGTPGPHLHASLESAGYTGFQTLPLLQLGYRVKAVDASEALLAELAHEAAAVCPDAVSRLQRVCGDILDSSNFIYEQEQEDSRCSSLPPPAVTASSPELIVCMGDTLTHLASIAEVNALLADAYAALVPGGRLIVQFRDLTQPLHGTDRFIPGIGAWELCKSWYKKLGLTSNYVSMLMQSHGFHVVLADNDGGMVLLMAVHP
ncbi:hypothetical protein BSLG_002863 [Batrachochytrium salamandrivorans]|nr:hypothetical protein BSLG_002863 [Batrachochytrium salamandrivorans]